jgi:hypothetical protein
VLWHANRTSFAWLLKTILSALNAQEKAARRAVARTWISDDGLLSRVAEFKENGYAFLTGLMDPEALLQLDHASAERLRQADELEKLQVATHKSFWVRLLDNDMQDGTFDCDNVFVRFALQPRVVEFIAAYLGELPVLTDVLLTYSRPSSADHSFSQLWHRDYDDTRTLKVFVYLSDVRNTADGPFTLLPAPESDNIGFSLKSHLTDERFLARTDPSKIKEICGPRLTIFVCETSRCFHMGSRVHSGHERLMYTATFISAPSLYPAEKPRFHTTRALSDSERLLLGI